MHLPNRWTFFVAAAALGMLGGTVWAGPEPLSSDKEMKQVAPAPPPECDSWTGFYFGGNAGYAWGNADTDFSPLPNPAEFFALEPITLEPDPSGFIGGGQIGFNWQFNKWLVLGIEADFQGTDIEGDERSSPIFNINGETNGPDSFLAAHERVQWLGSTRGRIGISPWCRWLFYATGGVAYGNVDYSADTVFVNPGIFVEHFPVKYSETNVGWIVGGGTEWLLTHHWSVKIEYLHYDLGDSNRIGPDIFNGVAQPPPDAVHYNFQTAGNIVRGGFNFKF